MPTPARTRPSDGPVSPADARERERTLARGLLADAARGHPRVLVVIGAAGMGKTTFAESIASECRDAGWAVAWCRDAGMPGEERDRPWAALLDQLGAEPADVRPDAVTGAIRGRAAQGPLLLIVEDADRMGTAAVELLERVARELAGTRALLLVTARDVLRLDGLLAESHVRHVVLGPLGIPDVHALAIGLTGRDPGLVAAGRLHRRSGGVPFFVVELLRDGGDPSLVVPPSIAAVARRHVAALDPTARRAIDVVAVSAYPVSAALVSAITGAPVADTVAALGAACASGLLLEQDGAHAFRHPILRDALQDSILVPDRLALHVRIASALESRADADDRALDAIARHYGEAAELVGVARALGWIVRAGRAAARRHAHEDAAAHFERAAALHDRAPGHTTAEDHAGLLHALGDERTRAGDVGGGRDAFLRAIAVARGAGAWPLVARAALGAGWWSSDLVALDRDVERALTEAADALGPEHDGLRAWVLARLARARYRSATLADRSRLSADAVALARAVRDPATLTFVLAERHHALWGPDGLAERLATADEMIRAADAGGDRHAALVAYAYRAIDLLEQGDATGIDHVLAIRRNDVAAAAPLMRLQTLRLSAMRATLRGDLAAAETLAGDAHALGRDLGMLDADAVHAAQMMYVRRLQGRDPEFGASLAQAFTTWPEHPGWQIGAAFVNAVAGNLSAAREGLERVAADDFALVPADANWIASMSLLADVAAFANARDVAATIYARLGPYADRHAVAGFGLLAIGPVAFFLARLAAVREEWDRALAHLDTADVQNAGLGAPALAVLADQLRGFVLLARRARGDHERGLRLLADTRERARKLGMRRVEENVTARLDTADASAVVEAPRPRTIRRDGDGWTLEVDGTTLRVRHCKGMTILAELLRHPGRAFHVRDLLAAEGVAVSGADLGPVLDARARLDYRRRIAELCEDEDDAEARHDLGRIERAREERLRLEETLARALGLGGRARQPGGATERARLVVRKRMRVALERIRAADAAIAHHLETAIRTGTLCVYRPSPGQHHPWLG